MMGWYDGEEELLFPVSRQLTSVVKMVAFKLFHQGCLDAWAITGLTCRLKTVIPASGVIFALCQFVALLSPMSAA